MTGISIAIATYNGARFIGEQLDSLARQTVKPDELVLTDDASTDGTLDVVAAFAVKAPFPVRYEKNPDRIGYQLNFMKAAGLCRNDLIAFCDQDDVWVAEKLARCLVPFENKDVLLVYHNATVTAADLAPIGTLEQYAAPSALNPPLSMGPWRFGLGFTLVFRRDLLAFDDLWWKSVNFIRSPKRDGHDQWYCFLASCLGTVAYIGEPLAFYRQHGANAFGWRAATMLNKLRNKLRNLLASELDDLRARGESAGKRAEILARIAEKLTGNQRARAASAAARYRRLSEISRQRQDMRMERNPLLRWGRLMALAWGQAYRAERHWGVGGKELVKDLVQAAAGSAHG